MGVILPGQSTAVIKYLGKYPWEGEDASSQIGTFQDKCYRRPIAERHTRSNFFTIHILGSA